MAYFDEKYGARQIPNVGPKAPNANAFNPAQVAMDVLPVTPAVAPIAIGMALNKAKEKYGPILKKEFFDPGGAGERAIAPTPISPRTTKKKAEENEGFGAKQPELMSEPKIVGTVHMPGNPGNYNPQGEGVQFETNGSIPGVTGYDAQGKPIFNRTEPATYTIDETGAVAKNNGQWAGTVSGGKGSRIFAHLQQPQQEGYGARGGNYNSPAPIMANVPDYSGAINSLLEQSTAPISSNMTVGQLVAAKSNRNAAGKTLDDLLGAQAASTGEALQYNIGAQRNLLENVNLQSADRRAAMAERLAQQRQMGADAYNQQRLNLEQQKLDLASQPRNQGFEPIYKDVYEPESGAQYKVFQGAFNKGTGQAQEFKKPSQATLTEYARLMTEFKDNPKEQRKFKEEFIHNYGYLPE